MKVVPDQLSPWLPTRLVTLGTDGFGRSDNREHLRRHFEVNAESIAAATLSRLARDGKFKPKVAAEGFRRTRSGYRGSRSGQGIIHQRKVRNGRVPEGTLSVHGKENERTMTSQNSAAAGENPLVPNAKLRQMYTEMLKARTLEESVAKKASAKGKKRVANIRGEEALRVSTAIQLGPDDLVSDVAATAGMGMILGGDVASLLRGLARAKADGARALAEAGVTRMLGTIDDAEERLQLATGAALALKTSGTPGGRRCLCPQGRDTASLMAQNPGACEKAGPSRDLRGAARRGAAEERSRVRRGL